MKPATAQQIYNVHEIERVSTDQQDLARQARDLARNREQYPINVLRKISMKISGTKVMTNEDFASAMESLKTPGCDGFSIPAMDRLFRPKDFRAVALLQEFHDNQKVIISKKEGLIRPWTPQGWRVCMHAVTEAGSERFELLSRTADGRVEKREEGKVCAVPVPYGLLYVSKYRQTADGRNQCIIEDPEPSNVPGFTKRQVIELIFSWRCNQRLTPDRIRIRLNEMGFTSPGQRRRDGTWLLTPGLWTPSSVRRILANRHYVGEHWERECLVCECPAFIERHVFDAVQRMRSQDVGHGRKTASHLLSRFLHCPHCSRRLSVSGGKYPGYEGRHDSRLACRCSNWKIGCQKIEAIVWRATWPVLTNPKLLLAGAQRYYEGLPNLDGAVRKLEKEMAKLKSRIENTKYMAREGVMDRAEGVKLIREDMQRIAEIEGELRSAGSVLTLPVERQVLAGLREIADPEAEPETFDDRRPILERIIDFKVTWDREKETVDIEGKVPVAVEKRRNQDTIQGWCNDSVTYIPFILKERVA